MRLCLLSQPYQSVAVSVQVEQSLEGEEIVIVGMVEQLQEVQRHVACHGDASLHSRLRPDNSDLASLGEKPHRHHKVAVQSRASLQ